MIPELQERRAAVEAMCRRFGVRRLDVFGSAAVGEFREDSDLDFLVEFGEPEDGRYWNQYFGLLFALEDLFGRHIDLVEEQAIKNPYSGPPPSGAERRCMRPNPAAYLRDVQQAAALIDEFVTGKTLADYQRDLMLRAAVERQFEIIGEALSQMARMDSGAGGAGHGVPEHHRVQEYSRAWVCGDYRCACVGIRADESPGTPRRSCSAAQRAVTAPYSSAGIVGSGIPIRPRRKSHSPMCW